MDNEEYRRRLVFKRGEETGGKNLFDELLYGGDPYFESGVKTHLLREQSKLLEKGREEENQARRELARREHAQDAVAWLLEFAEHEKRWEPYAEPKRLHELSEAEQKELYNTLQHVDDNVSRARADALRGDREKDYPQHVGLTVDTVLRHLKPLIQDALEKERTQKVGKASIDSLYLFQQINKAVARYLDGGYHAPYTKAQRPKHIESVATASQEALVKLGPVTRLINPATQAIIEQHIQWSVKDLHDEFIHGPELAKDYYKARATYESWSIATWLTSIALILVLLIFSIDVPWPTYPALIIAPLCINKGLLEIHARTLLKKWSAHLEKVGECGSRASESFKKIAGPSHPAIDDLEIIRVPERPV